MDRSTQSGPPCTVSVSFVHTPSLRYSNRGKVSVVLQLDGSNCDHSTQHTQKGVCLRARARSERHATSIFDWQFAVSTTLYAIFAHTYYERPHSLSLLLGRSRTVYLWWTHVIIRCRSTAPFNPRPPARVGHKNMCNCIMWCLCSVYCLCVFGLRAAFDRIGNRFRRSIRKGDIINPSVPTVLCVACAEAVELLLPLKLP